MVGWWVGDHLGVIVPVWFGAILDRFSVTVLVAGGCVGGGAPGYSLCYSFIVNCFEASGYWNRLGVYSY